MARNGDLTDRSKAGLRRRLRRLEAQARIGGWRARPFRITDSTIAAAVAIVVEHVGLDRLRMCLAAKPEDGGPSA